MKQELASLLDKDVTRAEFFKLLGFGIIAILGLGSLLQMLSQQSAQQAQTAGPIPTNYGSSAYGR